jgi:peroxiredoxin
MRLLLLSLLWLSLSVVAQERPDFTLRNLNGEVQNLSEWDGQVVLVNLWATWCPPCRHEIPYFVDIYEEKKTAGFVVVGIAFDDQASVKAMRDELVISYPLLLADGDAATIAKAYGNAQMGLPYTVLINREGKIVEKRLGLVSEEMLRQWLVKHL